MRFRLLKSDTASKARAGLFMTDHGSIPTPVFMPVGTAASVKGVHQRELKHDIGSQVVLGNVYHLYLRPGIDVLKRAGGIHGFMNWDGPVLTDSGGYQIYSLAQHCRIDDKGAVFKSHIDGSTHTFTPENIMDIQRRIGADIVMAFDECLPYPCSYEAAKRSMQRTHQWLVRCTDRFNDTTPKYSHDQALFGIVQGGMFADLRDRSAQFVATQGFQGNAIGGLSVGEPSSMMYSLTERVCDRLPEDKPRYLMGVGTPKNILECIALGVDMFDCVMPTRNARHGMLFTARGIINIRNEKWKTDMSPIDDTLGGYVSSHYSKAYLRHLIVSGEMLGAQIASIHNLTFYLWLLQQARESILNGGFLAWKDDMVEQLLKRI